MRDPFEGDLYSFSHRDINTCDLDRTGVCIQTYMIDVDIDMCVKIDRRQSRSIHI
jgi:hypothetical protein